MRVPGPELQALLSKLPSMRASTLKSRVYRAAAALVRVPETTIRTVFAAVKRIGWNLIAPTAPASSAEDVKAAEDAQQKNVFILKMLVREALSASVSGRF